MGKFLRFFGIVVVYVALASILLGLGIVGAAAYLPEVLGTGSIQKITGYSILLGLPFISCFMTLLSFTRFIKRTDEEAEYEDEEEAEPRETRQERKIRRLCEKLEKEGVYII